MFESNITIVEYTNKEDAKIIINKALYHATDKFDCILSANDRELNYCCPSIYSSESMEEFLDSEITDNKTLLILDTQFITLEDVNSTMENINKNTVHAVILMFKDVIRKLEPQKIYLKIHQAKGRELYEIKRLNNIISMYDVNNNKNSIEECVDEYNSKSLELKYAGKVKSSCITPPLAYMTREEISIKYYTGKYKERKEKRLRESYKDDTGMPSGIPIISRLTPEQRMEAEVFDISRILFGESNNYYDHERILKSIEYLIKETKDSISSDVLDNCEGETENERIFNYLRKLVQ